MYQIDSTNYRSPNRHDRSKPISMIVVHATASETLESAAKWLCLDSSEVSTHYIISQTGKIFSLVDDSDVAYHAGVSIWNGVKDVNGVSLGIELENRNDGKDPYTAAQIDALNYLVEWKIRQYKIDLVNVVRHLDVAILPNGKLGRKTDPKGFDWVGWKRAIEQSIKTPSDVWEHWGTQFPLYMDEKSFGIPQYWLKHSKVFGEARSHEIWIEGVWSYRVFVGGVVFYDKKTATVHGVTNTGLMIAASK
jgi:hypothetical protein